MSAPSRQSPSDVHPGGRHNNGLKWTRPFDAGQGTKNALLSLGPRQYLEIIAPDPDQPDADGALVTSLRRLDSPAVTGWAAALTGIDRLATRLRSNGYNVPKVLLTERPQQDGKLGKLRWFDITGSAVASYRGRLSGMQNRPTALREQLRVVGLRNWNWNIPSTRK